VQTAGGEETIDRRGEERSWTAVRLSFSCRYSSELQAVRILALVFNWYVGYVNISQCLGHV